MGDSVFILAYAGGLIGLVAAVLLFYVYQTTTALEVRYHKARERMQQIVQIFQSLDSTLNKFKEKIDAKASYEQTEKRLSEATSGLLLRDKQKTLSLLNEDIQVKVT